MHSAHLFMLLCIICTSTAVYVLYFWMILWSDYANRYSENDSDVSDIIHRNCWIHACAHMHEFILINYLEFPVGFIRQVLTDVEKTWNIQILLRVVERAGACISIRSQRYRNAEAPSTIKPRQYSSTAVLMEYCITGTRLDLTWVEIPSGYRYGN